MVYSENISDINEKELLEYYGYKGVFGKLQLRFRFANSWLLHYFAYSSLHSGFSIKMQKMRGVKIGKGCHLAPYVLLDLMYPHLITIEENVGIGSNTMIFTHVNPTANIFLKNNNYPRKVDPVVIKSGAWINPGCIIAPGTIIGKNSILSIGSVVTGNIPDNSVVVGNPGRIIKKI